MAQSPHSAAAHRGVVPSAWSGMPRSEGAYTRHAHCSALTLASRVHVSTATLQQPSHLVARHVTHGSRAAGLRPPPPSPDSSVPPRLAHSQPPLQVLARHQSRRFSQEPASFSVLGAVGVLQLVPVAVSFCYI